MNTNSHTVDRIERAISLMAKCIAEGQTPSLEALADAAALSKFHFHRVYRLVTGETSSQTMARLRLTRGVGAMQASSTTVTDAALSAGYSSAQAFAKVLKRQLSETPSSLRQAPERLDGVIRYLAKLDQSASANEPLVSVEVACLDPFDVVAVRTHAGYSDLATTYTDLFMAIGGAANAAAIIGLPHGDSEHGLAGDVTFDCAFKVHDNDIATSPSHLRLVINGGDFLLARHVGGYDRLPETVNALYATVISSDDFDFADRSCVFHYVDDPEHTPEDALRTDVYIPIDLPSRAESSRQPTESTAALAGETP